MQYIIRNEEPVITKAYVARPQHYQNPLNHTSRTTDLIITAALRNRTPHRHCYRSTASRLRHVHTKRTTDKRRRAHPVGQGWNSPPCRSEGRDPTYMQQWREVDTWRRRVIVVPLLLVVENWLALQRITVKEFCNRLKGPPECLDVKSVKFNADWELLRYVGELLIGPLHGPDGEMHDTLRVIHLQPSILNEQEKTTQIGSISM